MRRLFEGAIILKSNQIVRHLFAGSAYSKVALVRRWRLLEGGAFQRWRLFKRGAYLKVVLI